MPDAASSSKLLADFTALCLKETKASATAAATNTEPVAATTGSSSEHDPELATLRQQVRACGECLVRMGRSPEDFHRPAPSITLDRVCAEHHAIHVVDDYYLVRPPAALSLSSSSLSTNAAATAAANSNNSASGKAGKRAIDEIPDVRIAVVGNVDAGKSTTLGVLTKGLLDNGRGSARAAMFRHAHEKETGRTSSIGQEIVGVREAALVHGERWQDVMGQSDKILTFIDLAGHERYLKTTMFGLTGYVPDYAVLIVGSNAGLVGMTKEHLALSISLAIPLILIVTKVDQTPSEVREATIRSVMRLLKSTPRAPLVVKNLGDACSVLHAFTTNSICPIFQISNVTGDGVDVLKGFLALLPPKAAHGDSPMTEFCVTETYSVAGVGTVVAGTLLCGRISMGDALLLGPDPTTGAFHRTVVKGIQKKKVNCSLVTAITACSLALKRVRRSQIRKGTVLVAQPTLSIPEQRAACREFVADVLVLFHSTTITRRYQAMLHCGVIRQTVRIVDILPVTDEEQADAVADEGTVMRTGDRRRVRFRFMWAPEWMQLGQRLLFREGRTKGVGRVTRLIPLAAANAATSNAATAATK